MSDSEVGNSEDEELFVYEPGIAERLTTKFGQMLGWTAYFLVRAGFDRQAANLADRAISLCRHGRGAIRAIGALNGKAGRRALFRGEFMICGRTHGRGPFPNQGFAATYVVAAPTEARVIELVRRFERDAIPESLVIESGSLSHHDPGAEGVLSIQGGRVFWEHDE